MDATNAELGVPAGRAGRAIVMVAMRAAEEIDHRVGDALVEEARRRNWILLNPALSGGILPRDQRPAGAITTALPDEPLAVQLRELGVPVVRIGRLAHPDDAIMPAVIPDHAAAGRLAGEYFFQRGFRHFACIAHASYEPMVATYQALQYMAESHACRFHLHLFRQVVSSTLPADRFADRMREVGEWIEQLPKPVGILAPSDQVAAQLILLCQQRDLLVPEKLAVLGMGNLEIWCEMAPVPISSIDVDRRELTRVAVRRLDDLMQGNSAPPLTLVPPRGIVTRRSTDILAVADPMVARAIRWVWDHLDRDLSVDDVARAMSVARHTLDRAFRTNLGRGVKAELIRIRMERCCELLQTTDLPIKDLSDRLGYRTVQYLHNAFKKTFGISPRQFRLRMRGSAGADDSVA